MKAEKPIINVKGLNIKDNLRLQEILKQYEKALAESEAKVKELEQKVENILSNRNYLIYEKDKLIQELREGKPDCDDCVVNEKDKDFKQTIDFANKCLADARKEIARLRDELDSNSRDFWKAEAEKLKKENPDMIFHNHIKAHFEKEHPDWKVICKICGKSYEDIVGEEPMTVQQALSELREIVNSLNCFQGSDGDLIYKEKVLKAIDRLKEGK